MSKLRYVDDGSSALSDEAIKRDNRLTDAENRQKINWPQESTIIARTLSIDAIKVILAGAIL
jgi:hypothetical protein